MFKNYVFGIFLSIYSTGSFSIENKNEMKIEYIFNENENTFFLGYVNNRNEIMFLKKGDHKYHYAML